jgi:hypothetical protein
VLQVLYETLALTFYFHFFFLSTPLATSKVNFTLTMKITSFCSVDLRRCHQSATSAKSATKYISKLTEDIIHVHATLTTTTKAALNHQKPDVHIDRTFACLNAQSINFAFR